MTTQSLSVRDRIPALSTMTYLDSAGAGLPPLEVTQAMKSFVDDWSRHGEHWGEWLMEVVECRKLFGQLVGGKTEEVGVVPSVSVGLAAVASGVDFKRRKKIVTSELNFPTNVVLWQRMREAGLPKTVEVLRANDGVVPLEAWEKAIDEGTALVAVDYVSWFSGYRERVRDIADIAHRRGALVLVDGFHGLGVFPIQAKSDGIDAFFGGFYKWLCGPHGAACVYVDSRVLPGLEPAYTGWHGIKDNVVERALANRDVFDVPFPLESATPSATAARFEWGTWASVVVRGAIAALKFAIQTDSAARYIEITKRRRELVEGLEELGIRPLGRGIQENQGGGIVTFATKDHKALVRRLGDKGIIVSGRFNHVRVSPHFYNTPEEIDLFLSALKEEL